MIFFWTRATRRGGVPPRPAPCWVGRCSQHPPPPGVPQGFVEFTLETISSGGTSYPMELLASLAVVPPCTLLSFVSPTPSVAVACHTLIHSPLLLGSCGKCISGFTDHELHDAPPFSSLNCLVLQTCIQKCGFCGL